MKIIATFEFFTVNAKLAEMVILASKDLTAVKESYQKIATGLRV